MARIQRGTRRYMNMNHLSKPEDELLSDIIAGWLLVAKRLKLSMRKILDIIKIMPYQIILNGSVVGC